MYLCTSVVQLYTQSVTCMSCLRRVKSVHAITELHIPSHKHLQRQLVPV